MSTSVTPSEGIYNDVIVNLNKASNAIRLCISSAEKKIKVSLKKINVIFEQPDFLCTKFSKNKKIDGSKIHRDDIELYKDITINDMNVIKYDIVKYDRCNKSCFGYWNDVTS